MLQTDELIETFQRLSLSEQDYVLDALYSTRHRKHEIQSLADLESRYPGEWLAVVIPEGEDQYQPKRGYLVAHSPDRSFVWQQVQNLPADQKVFIFFNGPIAAKGFEVVFHDTADTPEVATMVES